MCAYISSPHISTDMVEESEGDDRGDGERSQNQLSEIFCYHEIINQTEKEIQKALENLVKGRTTIAIAHRLSTLHRADRLVVLDRGRIVEEGTHDALIAKEGAYFNLYKAQARNMDVVDVAEGDAR